MYKKRIIKPPNSKISSEHQTQSSSKIIVNRTNSNKDKKIQKPIHMISQFNTNSNNEIFNHDNQDISPKNNPNPNFRRKIIL